MSGLRALNDGIIFQFEEEIKRSNKSGTIKEQTDWGFDLGASFDQTAQKSRWCIIVAIGPDVQEPSLKVGARVFVEALKWTNGFEHEGQTYWKTDESHVLLIDTSDVPA